MDAVATLINASSDKIGFVGGVVFMLIVVFCKKPVVLGKVHLPAIDTLGRVISGIIGLILLLWAVFVWTANSNVGIFSLKPPQNSIVLKQEQPKRTSLSGGEDIAVYAHGITSQGSSNIILFKIDEKTKNILNRDISYSALKNAIGQQSIIWEGLVKQGTLYRFNYNGSKHILRLDRVDWFLVGPAYVVVTVQ